MTIAADHFDGVTLVGGGPGDDGLITVAGLRALLAADVVVADRLAPQGLLSELPAEVEIIDAAKVPRGPAMSQDSINAILIDRARAGRVVVRLKGGDGFVFGRGFEEVLALQEAGIPVRVIPGVSSSLAVPALAGIPVTHRGVVHEFTVVSGHIPPVDPASRVNWRALAELSGTIVLLMAVQNGGEIADVLIGFGRDEREPVAIAVDGSLPSSRVLRATLGTLGETIRRESVRPPAIIVVGTVAAAGFGN